MRRPLVLLVVFALVLGGAGCKKANDAERDREAIRVAIEKYLSERSDLNRSAMDVKIGQVKIEGNTAQAQVEFQAKGAAAGFAMQMDYALERQGDGWVVRSSKASGTNPMHPQAGAPIPSSSEPSDPLPADHPAVGSTPAPADSIGAGKLPAGHPPIGDTPHVPAKKAPAPGKK